VTRPGLGRAARSRPGLGRAARSRLRVRSAADSESSPSHLRVISESSPSHLRVISESSPSHLRVNSFPLCVGIWVFSWFKLTSVRVMPVTVTVGLNLLAGPYCCRTLKHLKCPLIIIRRGRPGPGCGVGPAAGPTQPGPPLTAAARTVPAWQSLNRLAPYGAHAVTPVPAADRRRGGPRGTRKPGRSGPPGTLTGCQVRFRVGLRVD
jgi:hypothetical protein